VLENGRIAQFGCYNEICKEKIESSFKVYGENKNSHTAEGKLHFNSVDKLRVNLIELNCFYIEFILNDFSTH
jgi:hypothetical protein